MKEVSWGGAGEGEMSRVVGMVAAGMGREAGMGEEAEMVSGMAAVREVETEGVG